MSTPIIPGCPALSSTTGIIVKGNNSVRFSCSRGKILYGSHVITCTNGTWTPDPPICTDPGGLTERDITIVFGIIGGAAFMASLGIFIGLIFMACYKKDRRNLYKDDVIPMDDRNGSMDEDIYYPPGYANPGPMVNGAFSFDRNSQPEIIIPSVTDMRRAIIYDPETMSKREVSWQYRLDGSTLSIPRPVVGITPLYGREESSTDWDYDSQPNIHNNNNTDRSADNGQLTM